MFNLISRCCQKVCEINARYEHPSIEMSHGVRVSLLVLRVYLFILMGLTLYKFVTLLK